MSDMPMKIVHVQGPTFYVCIGFPITLYLYFLNKKKKNFIFVQFIYVLLS